MSGKVKVLVVEDNVINAKLLSALLASAGFEVVHVADGSQTHDEIIRHPDINVILLDRVMPRVDGLELLMRLKKWPESFEIPVIMLTAALSPAQVEEARQAGAFASLAKPYDKDQIVATILKAVGA